MERAFVFINPTVGDMELCADLFCVQDWEMEQIGFITLVTLWCYVPHPTFRN